MKLVRSAMVVSLLLCSCSTKKSVDTSQISTKQQTASKKVLVFSKTLGWRHKSIETGLASIQEFGKTHNFAVVHTEDSLHFTKEFLPQYDAIVFLNTTGNVLDSKAQKAFEKYIQSGGSFLGIHSAADTEYDWSWYGKLVGGYFESHPNDPNLRAATVQKASPHKTTVHFPATSTTIDEWYNYKNINSKTTTVLTLDETSYAGGTNGDFHPIAWYHTYDGGKAYYIGAGHDKTKYAEPDFRMHLEQALLWCLE